MEHTFVSVYGPRNGAAILAEFTGNFSGAIEIFKEILKRNPNDFNATNSIAGLTEVLGSLRRTVLGRTRLYGSGLIILGGTLN